MDLTDLEGLTRPAILCQCLRCSSSLAVLENEWGKLSHVYAVPTSWLSVNLQRISVSSEQKRIPQTSEMSLLRGRTAQDVSCKLCQQKLAVLCGLDAGYVQRLLCFIERERERLLFPSLTNTYAP